MSIHPDNCPDCFHLWKLHGLAGCTAEVCGGFPLTSEPCVCDQAPPGLLAERVRLQADRILASVPADQRLALVAGMAYMSNLQLTEIASELDTLTVMMRQLLAVLTGGTNGHHRT